MYRIDALGHKIIASVISICLTNVSLTDPLRRTLSRTRYANLFVLLIVTTPTTIEPTNYTLYGHWLR